MKKFMTILVICAILTIVILSALFVITEKILLRSPILVHQNANITFVIGDVTYQEIEGAEWKNAVVGTSLEPGYTVKTGKKSIIDLKFHSGMAVRITENSLCRIDESTIKMVTVSLTEGSLYGAFEKLYKKHQIKVKTPTITASIRGTDLGFETGSKMPEKVDKKDQKSSDDEGAENQKPELSTTVYALTGITEVVNPEYEDHKVLLAYQKKITVHEGKPAGQVSDISEEDSTRIRGILNSIHFEEVLLISDKILFKSGSDKFVESSKAELDKIADILKKKSVTVRIIGHTDNVGGTSENQKLSIKRAEAIKKYLVSKEINEKKLLTAGFGESKPIAENDTKEGRALNRRVEFTIVEK